MPYIDGLSPTQPDDIDEIFVEMNELSEHQLSSSEEEYKFNIDYLSEPDVKHKYKLRHMNIPSVSFESSNVSTSCTTNTASDCKYDTFLNDTQENDEKTHRIKNENNKNKTPFSSPQQMLSTPMRQLNELHIDNESDCGTIYEEKYLSIKDSSPTTPANLDANFDIAGSGMSLSQSPPHSLNPSLLYGKLDQFSHSDIFQSTDSIQSDANSVNLQMDDEEKSNDNESNNRFFNFFKNNKGRRSTLSILLNALKRNDSSRQIAENESNEGGESQRTPCEAGIFCGYRRHDDGNDEKEEFDDFGVESLSELMHRLNTENLKYGRDNGQYLLSNCDRILNEEFEPTFDDLLQCHVRSTGLMFENHVICKSLPIAAYNKKQQKQRKRDIVFRVVDVGGHRNERYVY